MMDVLRQDKPQWTTTYNGIRFEFENPKEEDVLIEDIAHALSRINRYNGHHKFEHYSVAQHSIYVSSVLPTKYMLAGLLHDASEAYIQDIISPLKHLVRDVYMPLEEKVMRTIFSKFGLNYDDEKMWKKVKWADEYVFAYELRDIKKTDERKLHNLSVTIPDGPMKIIDGYSAYKAEYRFLQRFYSLQITKGENEIRKQLLV